MLNAKNRLITVKLSTKLKYDLYTGRIQCAHTKGGIIMGKDENKDITNESGATTDIKSNGTKIKSGSKITKKDDNDIWIPILCAIGLIVYMYGVYNSENKDVTEAIKSDNTQIDIMDATTGAGITAVEDTVKISVLEALETESPYVYWEPGSEILYLEAPFISDLNGVGDLEGIKALSIEGNLYGLDLGILTESDTIEGLSFTGESTLSKLSDYTGLDKLTNLTSLFFNSTIIEDLTGIGNHTKLLEIGYVQEQEDNDDKFTLTGLSELTNLNNLTTLYIENVDLNSDDLNGITGLNELTRVSLQGTNAKDINFVSDDNIMSSLNIFNTGISDVATLPNMANLTELLIGTIDPSIVINLDTIQDYKMLSDLILYTPNTINLDNLGLSRSISRLMIVGTEENVNIDLTRALDSGEITHIKAHHISNITGADWTKVPNLELLYAEYTNMDNMESLNNSGITQLGLISSGVANEHNLLENVKELPELITLELNNNGLEDTGNISNYSNLNQLYLNNNKIKDLSGLNNLKNLEYLNITNNPVDNIDWINDLTELKTVIAVGTEITEEKEFENKQVIYK